MAKTKTVAALPTKKELRKMLTAWKRGEVSKAALDSALGHPNARGKFVDAQWRNRLGIATDGRTREVKELV